MDVLCCLQEVYLGVLWAVPRAHVTHINAGPDPDLLQQHEESAGRFPLCQVSCAVPVCCGYAKWIVALSNVLWLYQLWHCQLWLCQMSCCSASCGSAKWVVPLSSESWLCQLWLCQLSCGSAKWVVAPPSELWLCHVSCGSAKWATKYIYQYMKQIKDESKTQSNANGCWSFILLLSTLGKLVICLALPRDTYLFVYEPVLTLELCCLEPCTWWTAGVFDLLQRHVLHGGNGEREEGPLRRWPAWPDPWPKVQWSL